MEKRRFLLTFDLLKKVKTRNYQAVTKLLTVLILCFAGLTSIEGQATGRTVTGQVTDAQNDPLPGVNVVVKGTLRGTITDIDGNYSIEAASEDVLDFSFVGFMRQEVPVGTQSAINVVLSETVSDLDEVIVVGYGVQRKSLVTGAISSVSAEDIATAPDSRVEQTLQGRTAGVTILPVSGSPGSAAKVRIRGVNTNANSNPLFIVDGMKTRSIDNIEPGDIESVEILKDAASAAIYGTEGGNGVILITTKGGKKGVGKVTYDFQYGIQSVKTKMELMNAEEYAEYMGEQGAVINVPAGTGKGTDWLDEIFETAPMQRHHISFSGGGEKTTYMSSVAYNQQDGVVGGDKASYERFSFRLNSTSQVKDWLEVGNTLSYSHSNRNSIGEDDEYRGVLNNALLIDPTTPVYYELGEETQRIKDEVAAGNTILQDEQGRYYGLPLNTDGEIGNPVAKLLTYNNKVTRDQLMGTVYTTISPVKGFSFTSRLGLDLLYQQDHNWNKKFYFSSESQNGTNTINDDLDKHFSWLWENFATYQFNIDSHDFTILAGYSAEKYQHPNWSLYSGPMASEGDQYAYHDHTTSRDQDLVGGDMETNTMTSIFGRLSYNYLGKYMVEVALRGDAASVFPENDKSALFPAFSAGWIVSEEEFWTSSFMDYLKVRGSWGQNGSKSSLPGNEDREFWTVSGIFYPNPSGGYFSGAEIDKLINDDLKWERTEQIAFGVDMRAMNGKMNFSVDYYKKTTRDLIAEGLFPLSVGNDAPFVNLGDVSNKGWEFQLGFMEKFGDVNFTANANLSTLNNEVTRLAQPTPISGANVRGYDLTWFEEGEPIWYFNGYKTDGINETTGLPNIVDVSGDGNITSADLTKIGDPHPDFIYGANINFEFKGVDLGIFLQGTKGNDIYTAWYRPDRPTSNKPRYFYEDRWTADNTSASMPRANGDSEYIYRSDLMIQDGSYTRIKQIQLGYSLPSEVISQVGLSRLRVYMSLNDFFTFTDYKGLDPEAGSANDQSQGIDRGLYPIPRKVMFGLSVNF
jgi:TonB-linked SusC/RagA family outer membrane protein